jgi:protein-disulfide isomerase
LAAEAQLIELRRKRFELRQATLAQMIDEGLLEAEAAKRSIELQQLFVDEVEAKVPEPSLNELAAFYEENKAQMEGTLAEMTPGLSSYLLQESRRERMMAFIAELRTSAGVKVYLEPERVSITGGNAARMGPQNAPIEVIEFSDFECPFCARGADVTKQLVEHYGDKVTIYFKHFPLPMHANANVAAQAAECANDQGKFWEYHDVLFRNQKALGAQALVGYAADLSLDSEAFQQCLSSQKYASRIDSDLAEGKSVGMSGTPGFYINGIPLSGAQPFLNFKQIIDAELAKVEAGR